MDWGFRWPGRNETCSVLILGMVVTYKLFHVRLATQSTFGETTHCLKYTGFSSFTCAIFKCLKIHFTYRMIHCSLRQKFSIIYNSIILHIIAFRYLIEFSQSSSPPKTAWQTWAPCHLFFVDTEDYVTCG